MLHRRLAGFKNKCGHSGDKKKSASAGSRTSVICSVCCCFCFSVVSIFGTLCLSKLYFALFVVISVSKISIKACPSHEDSFPFLVITYI